MDPDLDVLELYKLKVQNLFTEGYNLPSDLHVSVIIHIEGELNQWKEKLNLVTSQNVVTLSTLDTESYSQLLERSVTLGEVKQEIIHDGMLPALSAENQEAAEFLAEDDEVPSPGSTPEPESIRTRGSARKQSTAKSPKSPRGRKSKFDLDPEFFPTPTTGKRSSAKAISASAKKKIKVEEAEKVNSESPGSGLQMPKKCDLCFRTFNSRNGYIYHMKNHDKKSYLCDLCDFNGATKPNLMNHKEKVHGIPQEKDDNETPKRSRSRRKDGETEDVKCETCNKSFRSAENLKIHMEFHKNGKLSCPYCPKQFMSRTGYATHVNHHTGQNLHSCSQCPYIAGNLSSLNTHVRRVHDRILKHLCDFCGQGFVTKNRLARHTQSVHMKEQFKDRYACPHCDHKTHSESILKTHIRNIHMETERFMCNICGITLKYKHSLQDHQKRHSSKKMFQCAQCPFRGICAKDVKNHIRRLHMDPAFTCPTCGKTFKQKGHLQRHQVIHTGEKRFQCQVCSYCCNVQGNLRKHMVQVHKVNDRIRPHIEKLDLETEPIKAELTSEGAVQAELLAVTPDDQVATAVIATTEEVATTNEEVYNTVTGILAGGILPSADQQQQAVGPVIQTYWTS